jgi:hypothetical protein
MFSTLASVVIGLTLWLVGGWVFGIEVTAPIGYLLVLFFNIVAVSALVGVWVVLLLEGKPSKKSSAKRKIEL